MVNVNQRSLVKRWYKEINWNVHRRLAEEYFHKVVQQAKLDGFFEDLYVSVNANGRQIQIAAGSHPVGDAQPTFDKYGIKTGLRIPSENGATLSICQGPDGSVGIFLYPFESEGMSRKIPYITWVIRPSISWYGVFGSRPFCPIRAIVVSK